MRRSRSLRPALVLTSVCTSILLVASGFAAAGPGAAGGRTPPPLDASARLTPEPLDGKVAPEVLRQVRASGRVDALVVFAYEDALASAEAAAPERGPAARSRAIVASTRAAYAATKAAVLARLPGVQVLEDFDALPIAYVRFTSRAQLLAAAEDPAVVGVAENGEQERVLSQSLPLIGQPTAAAAGHVGTGTAVAVLDTGTDYTRSAFGSCTSPGVPAGCRVVVAQDFAPNDGLLDDPGQGLHGTNVSGVVAGVAPGTKILALDVFTPTTAWDTDVIAAINFTVANQATYNVRAMNLSLASGNDYQASQCSEGTNPYVAAFAGARAVGITPVVAAGNDAFSGGTYHIGIAHPACTPGAVSVGAVYDSNVGTQSWGQAPDTCTDSTTAADMITCFSQTASYLTLLGPGAMIVAAGITMGGTSQASPHVAGAAAVLAGVNPAATVTTIQSALSTTGPLVFDPLINMNFHRLDLPAAIAAIGVAPPPTGPTVTGFNPTSGPVGTSVTVFGTNLTGAFSVTFGGAAAGFVVNSATQITATVPAGAVTGQIGVSTPTGSALSAGVFTVTTVSAIHARSVSFYRASGRAKGRVSVLDGFSACRSGVPIKLQEKRGRWVTVATGTTSATGGFRATGLELQTRYRIVAPRKVVSTGDVCSKAVSPTLLWF
jgi:hypothetical protein